MDKELLQQFWFVLESPRKVSLDAYYDAIPWITKRKVTTHLEVVRDVSYQFKIIRTNNHYDIKIDPQWGDVTINYGWIITLVVLDEFTGEFTCLCDGTLDVENGDYDHARHLDFVLALILPDAVVDELAGKAPVSAIAKRFDIGKSSVIRRFRNMGIATWANLNVTYAKPKLNMVKWARVWLCAMIVMNLLMVVARFYDSHWLIYFFATCLLGASFMLFREYTFPPCVMIWSKIKACYQKIKDWFYV